MISLDSVSKTHGSQILFVDASMTAFRGERVGLVGPNGCGKSTIFRLIMEQEEPDGGQVSVERNATLGYFSQDVGEMGGATVLEDDAGRRRRGLGAGPRARASSSTRWPIRIAPTSSTR